MLHNFCVEELQRALSEQSFGIASFSITSSTSLSASASVALLEAHTITVVLSRAAGYSIDTPTNVDIGAERTFETIELLLQAVSPLYEQRRHDILIQRLESFS